MFCNANKNFLFGIVLNIYRAAATYAAVAALRDSIESGQIECDKLTPCAGSR
jgi:hypothetical protein